MAANIWTRQENERFKNAVKLFCAFSPFRFQNIAVYMHKPVDVVKEHYEDMVDDLMGIGSNPIFSGELTEAMIQSLFQTERAVWNREEHEWFLIGLKRFETDWEKVAALLNSKNPMQVVIYAQNYFHWQNSMKKSMNRSRANNITMVDPRGQQGSLFRPQSQPQQERIVGDWSEF